MREIEAEALLSAIDEAVDKDQVILMSGELLREWLLNPDLIKDSDLVMRLVDTVIRSAGENSRLMSILQLHCNA